MSVNVNNAGMLCHAKKQHHLRQTHTCLLLLIHGLLLSSSDPLLRLNPDLLPTLRVAIALLPLRPLLKPSLRPLSLDALNLNDPIENTPYDILITLLNFQIH